MPRSIRARASPSNLTSFAAIVVLPKSSLCGLLLGGAVFDHAHDVGLLHDEELLAIDLDLGARPLAEQHAIARPNIERMDLAVLAARPRARRHDFAFHRLFLDRVG